MLRDRLTFRLYSQLLIWLQLGFKLSLLHQRKAKPEITGIDKALKANMAPRTHAVGPTRMPDVFSLAFLRGPSRACAYSGLADSVARK